MSCSTRCLNLESQCIPPVRVHPYIFSPVDSPNSTLYTYILIAYMYITSITFFGFKYTTLRISLKKFKVSNDSFKVDDGRSISRKESKRRHPIGRVFIFLVKVTQEPMKSLPYTSSWWSVHIDVPTYIRFAQNIIPLKLMDDLKITCNLHLLAI